MTAVDAAAKLDLLRSIGADRVVDRPRLDLGRGERYDLVFDVPGGRSLSDWRRALAPGGKYVLIGHDGFGSTAGRWLGTLPRFMRLMAMSPFVRDALRFLADGRAQGKIVITID